MFAIPFAKSKKVQTLKDDKIFLITQDDQILIITVTVSYQISDKKKYGSIANNRQAFVAIYIAKLIRELLGEKTEEYILNNCWELSDVIKEKANEGATMFGVQFVDTTMVNIKRQKR